MSHSTKMTALFFLVLFSATTVNAAHLVIVQDPRGDTAGCVEMNKQFNLLALTIIPDNHPTVRVVEATYAGEESGLLWQVIEFDDLADMHNANEKLAANNEAMALQRKIDKHCPIVSQSIGTQLYYKEGT